MGFNKGQAVDYKGEKWTYEQTLECNPPLVHISCDTTNGKLNMNVRPTSIKEWVEKPKPDSFKAKLIQYEELKEFKEKRIETKKELQSMHNILCGKRNNNDRTNRTLVIAFEKLIDETRILISEQENGLKVISEKIKEIEES